MSGNMWVANLKTGVGGGVPDFVPSPPPFPSLPTFPLGASADGGHCGEGRRERSHKADGDVQGLASG